MFEKSTKTLYLFLLSCFIILINSFVAIGQDSTYNWDNYPIWENTTKYNRVYIVNQNHKIACDTNVGTYNKPLRTIAAATKLVKPGDKIVIYKGVYREVIEPIIGGSAPYKMISYESAIGNKVIIKGSKILEATWVKEINTNKKSIWLSV